jgi:parallel beta-helix repeat protein
MVVRMGIKKTSMMTILFSFILISVSMLFICIPTGSASRSIYVKESYPFTNGDGSGNRPYQSIQYALDRASDGDTIYVFEGNYNETLVITKQVSLIGINQSTTIISKSGENHRYLIEIDSSYVTLENLTISDPRNNNLVALVYITSDSVTLQSNNFSQSRTWGVYFTDSDDNTIGNNDIYRTKGIYLASSDNNVFSNNNFSHCLQSSIHLSSSNENIIFNNTFFHNYYDIFIQSQNNNVSQNAIYGSTIDGIKVYGESCTIFNNVIKNCGNQGIDIGDSQNTLRKNKLSGNSIGIGVSSSNTLIINNIINKSEIFGIYTQVSSTNNIFSLNHFDDNEVNAKNYGNNQWYLGTEGNYWDDYTDADLNRDHIGDSPYFLSIKGVDPYPLGVFLRPPQKPISPSPVDGAENVGLSVMLKVYVQDNDSSELNVFFYHATDDQIIGTDNNVPRNRNATCNVTLPFETTYPWYAVASDGIFENRSNIWIFTTRQIPPKNQKPVANPGGPYTAAIAQTISFDGSKSSDADGTIDFYRWNFGDGSSDILKKSSTHIYSSAGTYTVTLTVADNDGRSSTTTTTATIVSTIIPNVLPTAVITYAGVLTPEQMLIFSGSSSVDSDGTIANYSWNFGDGTTGYGVTAMHLYSTKGTYTVILTIIDDDGGTNSISLLLTISSTSKGFPGFELVIVFIAVVLVLVYRRLKV